MQYVSVAGVFCEDIREERSGQDTLVGIFPDNLNVPSAPGAMARLAVYVRLHFDASSTPPKAIVAKIVSTDGSEISLPSWDDALIEKGFLEARAAGLALAGFVLRAVMAPLPIKKGGVLEAKIDVDGTEFTAANLRIIVPAPAAVSPPL